MPDNSSTPNMTPANVSADLLANEAISLMTPFFLYAACLTMRRSTSAQDFSHLSNPQQIPFFARRPLATPSATMHELSRFSFFEPQDPNRTPYRIIRLLMM